MKGKGPEGRGFYCCPGNRCRSHIKEGTGRDGQGIQESFGKP